jgi:DNA-binding PadR family transcriptional regulator
MTLPASTYVVLGLIAKKPGSGYDTAAFADRSVRYFWPISRTQVYSELPRLEELGWVTGTLVPQDRYPDKRVYEPTPDGLRALRDWLDVPAPRQRIQDVVLRTFFGAYMSSQRLAEQLAEYRQQAEKLRAELLTIVEHLDAKGPDHSRALAQATARYGVLQAEATIAWTTQTQALLEPPQHKPG